ncbi:acyltransferase [Arthrobacter sp. CJ23]|uniref:acyltransferase family protein n=1 Tax=Arthrobacter sp. CJ23 TaxID=2972479 RepID=UPI00215CFE1B|nr:acyltransferase [Arthrobacter sp. CJ23]UVJ39843.1 acyltransferase [Arthrobacter sp. CJ23]
MGRPRQLKNSVGRTGGVQRDSVIDLVRFLCLALVVLGHSMMVSPVLHGDGTVTTENTLMEQPWIVPLTWILMVMPLFFVLGGVTGLESWRRLKDGGGTGFDYAKLRLLRLIRPAAALLAVMFVGLWMARLVGVDPQVIQLMTTGAGMPLWFLAAYLGAQLSVPLMARMHGHAPWLTLGILLACIITVDSLRGLLPMLAFINLIFVWCAIQQLGFFLADGLFAGRSRIWLLGVIAGSNLLLGVVTGVAVYPGDMLTNLNPPNLCLVLLGISQTATLQLLRPAVAWVAGVRWIHWVVSVVGHRPMTIYLWHLPLLVAMTGLLLLTDFPKPASGTAEWWLARPLVFLAVVVLLVPVLALFGRLEDRPTAAVHARGRPPAAVVAAGVAVFIPVVDAVFNGLTLELLGGGAACFGLAVLLLGHVPASVPAQVPAPPPASPRAAVPAPAAGPAEPLPAPGLSANLDS